ncbi:MAG: PQQ-binding-like beta-propeller repeat protein [Candidatus Rokubacteria bacterium]|nr:PQQ-binding-like beta-propeller repeat protein [Candidatus Rokubacteria bacterium]
MTLGIQVTIGLVYLLALIGLGLYGVNAYLMLAIHWWHRKRAAREPEPPLPERWPRVTVQLPLYNERYVARRLLEAAGRLDYPADRLEIQVLDDSTDDTTAILAETAAGLRSRGLAVAHLHRSVRTGFKAGALADGLGRARGEFIAIFDADFVPPPDFLRKTIPHFVDPGVAVVQARWGHLNRDFSLLTVAQSLGIDGHFGVEQSARCWGNLLLNFNGTAGVWRRSAIEDAGGWTHDTLTEDLDLSYRAQLRGWRIVYRPELVCPAELPVLITGFKSQQRRWAKGSIQTAVKLLPDVLRAPLPAWAKYQAFVHLTYYMIHPLMLAVVLLGVPLLALEDLATSTGASVWLSVVFGVATLGPGSMLVYAQRVLDPGWLGRIWRLPTIMIVGVGVAWSTSLAVLGAFVGRDREFIRTPKFGIGPGGGHWRGKGYRDRRPWGGVVEVLLGLYCAWTAWLFWRHGQYGVLPFLALYTAGFLVVGILTIVHATAWQRRPLEGRARRALTALGLAAMLLLGGALGLSGQTPPVPPPATVGLAQSHWPKYRHDLWNTGRSASNGPRTNALKWTFSTGRSEKDGGIETDPVIGPDGTVYLGANNGILYGLDPESGDLRWAFPTGFDAFGIYSTPAILKDGTVVFGAKDGGVSAIRPPAAGLLGELRWSVNLRTTIQTSPAVGADGTIYIGADDWKLYAIAPPQGASPARVKWRFETRGDMVSSPAVGPDGTIYFGSMDGKVYALAEPGPGQREPRVRWTFSSRSSGKTGGFENAPALDGAGRLVIGGNDGLVYVLNAATGEKLWTFKSQFTEYAIFSSAALGPDGTVYIGPKDGFLYALRESKGLFGTSGKAAWKYRIGTTIETSPALAPDGTVYMGADNGRIYAIAPPASGEAGRLLWEFQTKGTLISSPVIGPDGSLYSGSMDGRAYAFHDVKRGRSAQGPLSGTWYGTVTLGGQPQKLTLVLAQRQSQIDGVLRLQSTLAGGLRGTLQGEKLTYTASLLGECRAEHRGEASAKAEEIRGGFEVKDCQGRTVSGSFRVTR